MEMNKIQDKVFHHNSENKLYALLQCAAICAQYSKRNHITIRDIALAMRML